MVLVTGGSGLVGKGIQAAVEREGRSGERWVYLTSKDGDLRCVLPRSDTHTHNTAIDKMMAGWIATPAHIPCIEFTG